jgi:tetratricopeptide (TPR) repeat protein
MAMDYGWLVERSLGNISRLLQEGRELLGLLSLVRAWRPFVRKARPGRITIALARLEGDTDRECERVLVDALQGLKGVELIRVPRMVRKPDTQHVQRAVERAEKRARKLLERTGADVLLWGGVLVRDSHTIRLQQTTSPLFAHAITSWKLSVGGVEQPVGLCTDLTRAVSLLLRRRLSQVERECDGRYVVDKLDPNINHARHLLANPHWHDCCLASVRASLGYALTVRGQQSGSHADLVESVALIRESLKYYTRKRCRGTWATVRNNFGNALHALGERQPGKKLLNEAADVYLEILFECPRDEMPRTWTRSAHNLAVVYNALGARDGGTMWTDRAIDLYDQTVQVWTFEKVPGDYALARFNQAAALYTRWQRTRELQDAQRGLACCNEARKCTRESAPLRWASATNNAGILMHAVSEDLAGAARREMLAESEQAFRDALEIRTRDRMPLHWAETVTGLACVRLKRGTLDEDPSLVKEGIRLLEDALGEFQREQAPGDWAEMQDRIGDAYEKLGKLEGRAEWFRRALECYREMFKVLTLEGSPFLWASATGSVALVLTRLGDDEPGTESWEQAMAAYECALPIFVQHLPKLADECRENMGSLREKLEIRKNRIVCH